MTSLREMIARALPLKVEWTRINDPVVTMGGEGWHLALVCPWEVVGRGSEFDWASDSFEEAVEGLPGLYLREVSAAGDVLVDPTFRFDGGLAIVVHADTDLDPWVFSVPGLVLVGRKAEGGPA